MAVLLLLLAYNEVFSMTEKDLKKLSRADLLQMLIDQSAEVERLRSSLTKAENALMKREISIQNAGSIAEAALQLNGIFEAAQASCEQYMENIRTLSQRQEEVCTQMEKESREKADKLLADTEKRCADMEKQTKAECDAMVEKAKAESQAHWDAVKAKLDAFCEEHTILRDLLAITMQKR